MSSFIGNQPATSFESPKKQVSTSNSGTTITLDYPVTSVADIRLTINAVVQSYDNYSVSGSTLTVGGTLNNDRVEILFVGRTYGSIAPSDGSIVTSALQDDAVTEAKIADASVDEARLKISNSPTNGYFLSAQSGNTGGLTWAEAGGDLSFGGDTFGADKTIGSNDNYALSIETNNTERLKFTNDGRGLAQFTAKAWCTANGTGTVAIIDSHNISSLSDPESGQLTHNFANNMANANYTVIVNSWQGYAYTFGGMDMSTSSFKAVQSNGSSYVDTNRTSSLVFGD